MVVEKRIDLRNGEEEGRTERWINEVRDYCAQGLERGLVMKIGR